MRKHFDLKFNCNFVYFYLKTFFIALYIVIDNCGDGLSYFVGLQ